MSYPNPHAARCETVEQSQHLVPPTEIATSLALLVMTEEEKLLAMAFPYCHCKPFTRVILSSSLCHSERAKRPKNLAQGKLSAKNLTMLRTPSRDPSLSLRVTSKISAAPNLPQVRFVVTI
jgi:hypothetical protein